MVFWMGLLANSEGSWESFPERSQDRGVERVSSSFLAVDLLWAWEWVYFTGCFLCLKIQGKSSLTIFPAGKPCRLMLYSHL